LKLGNEITSPTSSKNIKIVERFELNDHHLSPHDKNKVNEELRREAESIQKQQNTPESLPERHDAELEELEAESVGSAFKDSQQLE
jgi:hypothetical protein